MKYSRWLPPLLVKMQRSYSTLHVFQYSTVYITFAFYSVRPRKFKGDVFWQDQEQSSRIFFFFFFLNPSKVYIKTRFFCTMAAIQSLCCLEVV